MSLFLILSATILAPALAALLVCCARSDAGARRVALAGAALTLGLSLAALALFHAAGGAAVDAIGPAVPLVGARLRLVLNGFSASLLPLLGAMLLALIAAGPRAALDRRSLAAVLATGSAILAVYCAADLVVLAAAWVAAFLPGAGLIARRAAADRLLRRTYRIFLIGGTAPLVLALGVIAALAARRGAALPFDIAEVARAGVPEAWQSPLFALIGISVLMRMAAVPFHGWLPVLLERGPLGVTVLLAEMQVGVCVLVRVVVPLLPESCAEDMPILAALGLFSALHGAILALTQTDLRRMIGYLVASQKGLVLLGIASMNPQSLSGALLQSFALSISVTGVTMVVWAIEARTGTADVRELGGLVASTPRMAAFFLLLACATIGLPGALTFIGEDLLLHGILHVHPVLAVLMLGATALNGITMFRAFQRAFLGPLRRGARGAAAVEPLLFRERAALLSLLALTVTLGVAPSRLLALHAPVVERVLTDVSHGAGGAAGCGDACAQPGGVARLERISSVATSP